MGRLHWSPLVLWLMRLGVAALVLCLGMHQGLAPYAMEAEKAHGLAKIIPLMWMLEPTTFLVGQVLAIAGLACFVWGLAPCLTLLPPILYGTIAGTLRQSMGDTTHSTQLLYMVLIALWLGYLVPWIHGKWSPKQAPAPRNAGERHRTAMVVAISLLAASYVASGIVKLKESRGRWVQNVPNMAVQMVKSNLSDYYSKPTGEISAVYADKTPRFFAEHPALAKLLFAPGLFLELGAILLIFSRRWSLLMGLALLAMHLGISWLMAIEFWGHCGMLLVLCILPNLFPAPPTPGEEAAASQESSFPS